MSNDAIGSYLRRGNLIEQQAEKLIELAAQTPDEVQPATVFFGSGLSYRELQELHEDFSFEVIDVSVKAPQGNQGIVMSISGGMADLWAIKGTLEERLTFMISSEQRCFAKMAKFVPPDQYQGMVDLATKPFRVYSARVFAPNRALAELQQQPAVRAIILNLKQSLISDFQSTKADAPVRPHRYFVPGFQC
jgi:hypothetical protein